MYRQPRTMRQLRRMSKKNKGQENGEQKESKVVSLRTCWIKVLEVASFFSRHSSCHMALFHASSPCQLPVILSPPFSPSGLELIMAFAVASSWEPHKPMLGFLISLDMISSLSYFQFKALLNIPSIFCQDSD